MLPSRAVPSIGSLRTVYDEFLAKVTDKVRALRQGKPDGGPGSVEVGAMTFPPQVDIVVDHVNDALAKGARAIIGGHRGEGPGHFFEPTVLVDVDHSMKIMQEETFGPTLPIMKVKNAEEALRLANDTSYGLGGSVFSRDTAKGEAITQPTGRLAEYRTGHPNWRRTLMDLLVLLIIVLIILSVAGAAFVSPLVLVLLIVALLLFVGPYRGRRGRL